MLAKSRFASFCFAALAAALLVIGCFPAQGVGSVSCAHADPPNNELLVQPFADPDIDLDFAGATISRSGNELTVRDFESVTCNGPLPTLQNTEAIDIPEFGLTFATVSLTGGPLSPGGSTESDGSNEVEVHFIAGRQTLAYSRINGTARGEHWVFGRRQGRTGVSLDPQRRHEFDATYSGRGRQLLVADTRGGADIIRGDGVGSLAPVQKTMLVFAGAGDDRVQGGRHGDSIAAGDGADHVLGHAGNDLLIGGPGPDRLAGDRGRDQLRSRDSNRDIVLCGPGDDKARVDKHDIVRGCESIQRHRPHPHRQPCDLPELPGLDNPPCRSAFAG